jgi:hypothetical protein
MAEEKESLEETGEAGAGEEKVEEVKAVKEADKDARLWGMLCHLAGLAGFAFPFGNVILPLIFWQLKKNEYAFADAQGKEAVNFQISMTIYGLVTIPLFFLCIGPFLLAAVAIVDLVLLLIAAIKANNGESYRYPLAIRLIK